MKKVLYVFIMTALIGAAWLWGRDRFWGPDKAQARYLLTKVERRDMVNSVSATGELSAVVTVEVGTEVSGQIKELLVDFNSEVRAGQIIARIDPESYETLVRQADAELAVARAQLLIRKTEISRYKASLENAQANWAADQAQVKKSKATRENARRNMKRKKTLLGQNLVSENDFDSSETAYKESAAQLEQAEAQALASESSIASAKASLAIAKAQVSEAEATVELKIAAKDKRMVDLDNTIIRSPVDGVVIDRNVDVGQTVAASLSAPTLFTIAQDLRKMQVSAYVDEADIGRIKEGQPAIFTVDAFGTRQFNGAVRQVRKMGETVQNVVTYEVIISADNRDLRLMPGMTADVQIELLKKTQVLVIANAALRFKPPNVEPESSAASQTAFSGGFPPIRENGSRRGGPPDQNARIKELTARLNLTESQQDELKEILQQACKKMRPASQTDSGNGPSGMSGIREKMRKESDAAIARILDSRQYKLYEDMRTQGQQRSGTLWRRDASGDLKSLPVVLGAGDASCTEISGPAITEGMEVVKGIGK